MPAADTHETFVLKVTKLLISRYTLGSTIYIDAKTEMNVHCQKHGWFTQKASFLRSTRTTYHCDDCLTDHLRDRSGDDTKSWIAKAEAVFTENEYNFDNTIYVNSRTKLTYLCNRCGEPRTKIPATMLSTKKGCPPCDRSADYQERLKKKKEYLLTELTRKFPDYIFDLSVFTALHKNISYTCDKGHKRKGVPNNLKSGKGCTICGHQTQGEGRRTKKLPWVKKAQKIHGKKYGYHLVDETFTQKSLQTIFCYKKDHGEFLCRPSNHTFLKRGCWRCAGMKQSRAGSKGKLRISQQEFLKRAESAHPHGLYDFSSSEYYGAGEHISFYCNLHLQECKILPENLWRGSGCYDCGMIRAAESRRLDHADFLAKCINSHEDDYDYSMVDYVNSSTHVIVGCYEHGYWSVLPSNHMYGKSRCPVCSRRDGGKKRSISLTKDTEWFVSVAEEIHYFKYDYSKTEYKSSRKKLWIECPESGHEPFEQWPRVHLSGKGCPACGRESAAAMARLTHEEVVERFTDIHRDRYDYSKAEIYGTDSYIKIGCPEETHPIFIQKVSAHLEGKGCPRCSLSKGETAVARLLDLASVNFEVEFVMEDGVDNTRLRFDFYIPNQNVLIEYDGEQHYRPVTFGGMTKEKALEVHKKIKSRDHRKNVWALDKGYRLIRIRFDEDISTVLACEGVIKPNPTSL
tara:strand:+ start:655 stop:2709 length:2055 start_codon:yes stop_codon:yes gene_type:complete